MNKTLILHTLLQFSMTKWRSKISDDVDVKLLPLSFNEFNKVDTELYAACQKNIVLHIWSGFNQIHWNGK